MTAITDLRCERCGETLTEHTAVWLELNSHTGAFTDRHGAVPQAESQGWFPFGRTCSKVVLTRGLDRTRWD